MIFLGLIIFSEMNSKEFSRRPVLLTCHNLIRLSGEFLT